MLCLGFTWPYRTVLIAGDYLLSGLQQRRMCKMNLVKVRDFGGATIADMYYYLTPLLRKQPSTVILHVHSNSNNGKIPASELMKELSDLAEWVQGQLPKAHVAISCPILRTDDSRKNAVQKELTRLIVSSKFDHICNDTILERHLGKRGTPPGLHLNGGGSSMLAANLQTYIRPKTV